MIQSIPHSSRQPTAQSLHSPAMTPSEQRAEWIELQVLRSVHENCPDDVRERLGLELHPCGDVLCALARHDSSILLNRAAGLGVPKPAHATELRQVMETYERAGIARYLVHLHRDRIDVSDEQLDEAGLEKARGWRKFHRDLSPPVESDTELSLRELQPSDERLVEAFAQISAQAFDLTSECIGLITALVRDPRWHLFLTLAGESPAGTGALFVDAPGGEGERIGWLDFGATAPQFRRRGAQRAVMARRIARAIELGCSELVTATGEAVLGDPQHSYRNILRAGFVEGRLRENWRPRSTPAAP